MKNTIVILWLMVSFSLYGQNVSKRELRYVPKTFNESLVHLEKILPDTTKSRIISMTESSFLSRTNGQWLINNWLYKRYLFGLIQTRSNLKKYFHTKGLYIDVDIAQIILRSFYRQLNNVELNLDEQIKQILRIRSYTNEDWQLYREQQLAEGYISLSMAEVYELYTIGDTVQRHFYYERCWFGVPHKDTVVSAIIADKSLNLMETIKLNLNVISFGVETDERLIYELMQCDPNDCWVNLYPWIRKRANGE